jgi:hypothetical protein
LQKGGAGFRREWLQAKLVGGYVEKKYYFKAARRVVDKITGEVHLRPLYNWNLYSFKPGNTYEARQNRAGKHEPPSLGSMGFHACVHPFDILYPSCEYTKADALLVVTFGGDVVENEDSTHACSNFMTVILETT